MFVIILEGVLFVALVATAGALLILGVWYLTPLGRRLHQARNRRRIDRAAELACPIHGVHRERDLVRLTSGEEMCPECYKETVDVNYGR
jgi:hypothetical protein